MLIEEFQIYLEKHLYYLIVDAKKYIEPHTIFICVTRSVNHGVPRLERNGGLQVAI
jgi:hypothetical protein